MLSLAQQKQDEALRPRTEGGQGRCPCFGPAARTHGPRPSSWHGDLPTALSLCSARREHLTVPVPSGVDLTKVGSIFTEAVGLVSAPSPFSISFPKRWDTSWRVSSESRMWYRYLSI